MSSLAAGYFPLIRYREDQKLLWDPVWKRTLKVRPEERVRQQWIDLLLKAGWSRNRISTELPVQDRTAKGQLRADLLCYDQQLQPLLLIECKAPDVRLRQITGEQAARYNQHIGAPFILLTNGRDDRWYQIVDSESGDVGVVSMSEQDLIHTEGDRYSYQDWQQRGFLGMKNKRMAPTWINWLKQWNMAGETHTWEYLDFGTLSNQHLPTAHYYRMVQQDEVGWAWSLLRGFDDHTYLVTAKNEHQQLSGHLLLEWNQEDETPVEARWIGPQGVIGVNDSDHLHLISQWQEAETIDDFANALEFVFQHYQTTD
jgi:hypothetical protein